MERARNGDESALGQLMDSYRSYLLLVANEEIDRRIVAKCGASDVVQVSMLHAQQAFERFEGSSENEFRAWLRSILKHDLLKAQRGHLAQKTRRAERGPS